MKGYVGFDLDDVLFPWTDGIHALSELAGLNVLDKPHIDQWNIPAGYGCDPELFWKNVNRWYEAGFLLQYGPVPGALEAVQTLQEYGFHVEIITARGFEKNGDEVKAQTIEWLSRHEFEVPVRFSKRKESYTYLDYFLDDKGETVRAMREKGIEAFLMHKPHNAREMGLPRMYSPLEYAELIISDHEAMSWNGCASETF